MTLKIYDIDENSFCVSNPDGDDYVIGYEGEPDSDSSGTLVFHIADAGDLDKSLHGDLLSAVEDSAPYEIYQFLMKKMDEESRFWEEERYRNM